VVMGSPSVLEGARSYDEDSSCSPPLPYGAVHDFQIHQSSGRNQVNLVQPPDRMNNYTALFAINDDQGGGDHYSFTITWGAEGGRPEVAAPFFDDVRACQDAVRQRFLSRNGGGSYVDFEGGADRQTQGQGRELLRGHGAARSRSESRDLTYSCVIDTGSGQVRSGEYQYSGQGLRTNDRNPLK
jgi:hypothetical protein